MIKYFRCTKCNFQFCASARRVTSDTYKCGAVIDYIPAENPEAGDEGPVKSLGMKPLGCGGEIKEITREEAINDSRA